MSDIRPLVTFAGLTIGLSGLPGCGWLARESGIAEAAVPQADTRLVVMAELGLLPVATRPAVTAGAPGPSLVAGDPIAVSWASTHGYTDRFSVAWAPTRLLLDQASGGR